MSEGRCVSGFHLIAAAEKAVFSRDALRSCAWTGRGDRCVMQTNEIRTGSSDRKDLDLIVVHGVCILIKVKQIPG
jgi:hypothetical protein